MMEQSTTLNDIINFKMVNYFVRLCSNYIVPTCLTCHIHNPRTCFVHATVLEAQLHYENGPGGM